MKLVIGNKNYSSWSLRPWLLLAYYRLEFQEIRVSLFADDHSDRLRLFSGTGLVPVVLDGPVVVWDSLAICEYVSERYLSDRGWPAAIEIRAEARSCSAEMHSGFPNIRSSLPMNARATGRRVEMTEAVNKEIQRVSALWNDLRGRFADRGPWLFGDFSIADCMYAPMAFRFNTYGVPLEGLAQTYMKFVLAYPAMQNWLEAARAEKEVIESVEIGL